MEMDMVFQISRRKQDYPIDGVKTAWSSLGKAGVPYMTPYVKMNSRWIRGLHVFF